MEILLQVIEEEVNSAYQELLLEDYDDYGGGDGGEGKGLGRIVNRSNTVGMLLSPVADIWNAVTFRAAEAGIKAVKTIGELVANTITSLLPFNEHSAEKINDYFKEWEHHALSGLDRQFADERGQLDEGWKTFKTDFWGIGFVAAPMGAIAGLAVGGKALDTAFSVLNTVSGGRAGRVYDLISGERARGDIFEAATNQPKFKDLPQDQKKKVLDELMENPEVVKAVDSWSTENLPKVLGSVVHDMNEAISTGQAGPVSAQEIASYKAMAPELVPKLFEEMKGKNEKFDIKPSPAALEAAKKVVEADIKRMPDLPVGQPQAPAQPVAQQPQATQSVAAGVQTPQPKQ